MASRPESACDFEYPQMFDYPNNPVSPLPSEEAVMTYKAAKEILLLSSNTRSQSEESREIFETGYPTHSMDIDPPPPPQLVSIETSEKRQNFDPTLPPNVLKPTLEELKHENFERFIMDHEREGYALGFLRIQPPPEFWRNIQISEDEPFRIIPTPTRQRLVKKTSELILVQKSNGNLTYRSTTTTKQRNKGKRKCQKNQIIENDDEAKVGQTMVTYFVQERRHESPIPLTTYRQEAEERKSMDPSKSDCAQFWEKMDQLDEEAVYGDAVPGTRCRYHSPYWCLPKLQTLLNSMCSRIGEVIPGVNTSYLYYGDWLTNFGWHVEDLLLFSVSYLHEGADKVWYIVPPTYRKQVEKLFKKMNPQHFTRGARKNGAAGCPNFMHHKRYLMNPDQLQKLEIPCTEVIQKKEEIIITFPGAFHSGFNCGFNCAEAINFAMPSWLPYGLEAKVCHHDKEAVRFSKEMQRIASTMAGEIYAAMFQKGCSIKSKTKQLTTDELVVFLLEQDPAMVYSIVSTLAAMDQTLLQQSSDNSWSSSPSSASPGGNSLASPQSQSTSPGGISLASPHSQNASPGRSSGGSSEGSCADGENLNNVDNSVALAATASVVNSTVSTSLEGPTMNHGSLCIPTKNGFECTACGKSYRRKRDCEFHIREKHKGGATKKKPIRCPHCQRLFYNKSSLKIHMRRLIDKGEMSPKSLLILGRKGGESSK